MAITPTSQLFTAISLTDLAKPAARAPNQAYAEVANGVNTRRSATVGDPRQVQVEKQHTQKRPLEADKNTQRTAAKATDTPDEENRFQAAGAQEFRREAVGTRPQFQKLGQLVDLSI